MKRTLPLLLLPFALFAQVEVDTIIDLGQRLYYPCYVPELHKLYLSTDSHIIALECSTWQITAEFPFPTASTVRYTWNPARRKLYVTYHIFDSTLVIYPDADTAHWIPQGFVSCTYAGSRDRLYGRPVRTDDTLLDFNHLRVLDCSADTVIKFIESPIPGYGPYEVSWDSVANRVFAGIAAWGAPPHMAVYDVETDSLLALFPTMVWPPQLLFHHPLRKAYFVSNAPIAIDTDRLQLIKRFPFRAVGSYGHGPVAVNALMDKVYFGGHRNGTACTLFVVDATTDKVIKEVAYRGDYPHYWVVWVPWSNRVYFSTGRHLAVLDCETDSIIVPELVLPGQTRGAVWLLLDPVRERIFAIGAHPNMIHVLRDVPYGVEETPDAGFRPPDPGPTVVRGVLNLTGLGHDPNCRTIRSCPAPALLDISGRKVMDLHPGENDVRHLAPGVYFIRTALWERSPDPPAEAPACASHADRRAGRDFVRKVVIQR